MTRMMKPRPISYILPGKPIPLQRPRYTKDAIYDAQKKEKAVSVIHLQQQHDDNALFEGPLELNAVFYFPTPSKTRSLEGKFHQSRPDLDNLVKYIADVSNGVLYKDDASIAIVNALKLYSSVPRTEFSIYPVTSFKNMYHHVYQLFVKTKENICLCGEHCYSYNLKKDLNG